MKRYSSLVIFIGAACALSLAIGFARTAVNRGSHQDPTPQIAQAPSQVAIDASAFVPAGLPIVFSNLTVESEKVDDTKTEGFARLKLRATTPGSDDLTSLNLMVFEFDTANKLRRVDGFVRNIDLSTGKTSELTLGLGRRIRSDRRLVLSPDHINGRSKRWKTDFSDLARGVAASIANRPPPPARVDQEQPVPDDAGASHPFARLHSFVSVLVLLVTLSVAAFAQTLRYTENSIDQTMRSNLNVDPSTLNMSFSVTLGGYPGRGVSLPVTMNYSSKVWRMRYNGTFQSPLGTIYTHNVPEFGEKSVAGWTTTLDEPYIEYTPQAYDVEGNPQCTDCEGYQSAYWIERVIVHLPGGMTHELRRGSDVAVLRQNYEGAPPLSGVYVATDGSRLKFDADQQIIYQCLWRDRQDRLAYRRLSALRLRPDRPARPRSTGDALQPDQPRGDQPIRQRDGAVSR